VLEGTNLVHYWRANDAIETPWRKGDVISTRAIAPGCIVQSDFMSGGHGNLEAVVPEAGGALVHYWRDSGRPGSAWSRVGVVTTGLTGGCAYRKSHLQSEAVHNLQTKCLTCASPCEHEESTVRWQTRKRSCPCLLQPESTRIQGWNWGAGRYVQAARRS
jgi:hypothetical protein